MNSESLEDNIIIRKANIDDDFVQIARLIYKTDDYIYPYWFHDNIEECTRVLPSLMKEEGFFFNYQSMYVAIDKTSGEIVGFVNIVLPETNLEYDYSKLRNMDARYAFTIDNYIMDLIKEVDEFQLPYISNICIDEKYRGMHVGYRLLDYVITDKMNLYQKFLLDVLSGNPAAIRLYQKIGFKITSPETMGIGYGPGDYVGQYSMELDTTKRR